VVSHVILCSPIYDALHFSSLIKSLFLLAFLTHAQAQQLKIKGKSLSFFKVLMILLSNNLCYMFVYIIHLKVVYLINIMLFW